MSTFAIATTMVCGLESGAMKQSEPLPNRIFRLCLPMFGGLIALAISFSLTACDKGDAGTDAEPAGGGAAATEPAKAAAGEAQTIVLERPSKVGDKYHLSGEERSKKVMEMSMNGQAAPQQSQSEDFIAKIEADVEVIALNEAGKVSAATIQVISLARSDDGDADSNLLSNAKVDAISADGVVTYSVGGTPVEEKTAETLKLFSLVSGGENSKDQDIMFGTDEARKPGDEWEIDGAAVADSFSQETGMQLSAEGVKGTMKFEKVEDVGGVPCQIVSGVVTMELTALPGLTADAKLSNSTVTLELEGAFPTDATLQPAEKSMTMKMAPNVAFSEQGIAAEVKMDMMRTTTAKITAK